MKNKNPLQIKALLFVLLLSKFVIGQDPNFSQFYNNPLYYNPALSGINSGLNINTQYRVLWPRINSDFRTFNFTIDVEEINVSGGLGIIASSWNEGNGFIKSTKFGGTYSYRFIVIPRQFIIQTGFEASYIEKGVDYSKLVFSDQLDPVYGNVNPSSFQTSGFEKVKYPDFSTGVVGRFNAGKRSNGKPATTSTIGVAFHHVTTPNESFNGMVSNLPMKTVIHANSIIPVKFRNNSELKLAPAVIYEKQGPTETFTGGINVVKDPIFIGLWTRNKNFFLTQNRFDALIAMVGINTMYNDDVKIRFGYSYDITVSKLRTSSAGSHEVTISIEFGEFKLSGSRKGSVKQIAKGNIKCYKF